MPSGILPFENSLPDANSRKPVLISFDRILSLFWRSIDIIMVALLTCMVVLVFSNVVLRYGFSSGIRPAVELSRLGFVWIVMLGAAVTLRHGEHLSITDVSEALLPKFLPLLRRVACVVILVSMLMLFWGASKQVLANWNNISQLTGLPKSLLYVPACFSGFVMGCIAIQHLISGECISKRSPDS